MTFRSAILAGVLLAAWGGPARAQGSLSRAYPNGGQRGTTVEVTFAGADVPDDATLMVQGAGITGDGAFKKGVGKLTIAPDAVPGVRQLRLKGAKGVTSPRPFSVGAVPELLEKEPNNDASQAQRLEKLPVTVNGTVPTRADLDVFTIPLAKGECLVIAGEARSLGNPTNLLVRIRNVRGQELLIQMDQRTRDPLVGFTAPESGDYVVELQDVMNNYSNIDANYVYRVTFTKGPWLDSVFPPGAPRGATTSLTFSGWNLGGKPGPGTLTTDVAVPADAPEHFEVSAGGALNQLSISTSDVPNSTAAPTTPPAPRTLTLPTAVNGMLPRGTVDRYQFTARAGERLVFDAEARQLGSYADLVLSIRNAQGKVLGTYDDDGRRDRDPQATWTAPEAGSYVLSVRDVAYGSRGGPEFFYRVTIAPPGPSLEATTPDPTLVLKPGGTLDVPVKVIARGLGEPAIVTVEGLPAGVTAAPVSVTQGGGDGKVSLKAEANVTPGCAPVRLVARSGKLTTTAAASWVLSTDRSGTLAQGSTDTLALLIPAP